MFALVGFCHGAASTRAVSLLSNEAVRKVMPDVILYGTAHCKKTSYYVNYRFADVAADSQAAEELVALTGSADKFPTFSIDGRKLRNPSLEKLEKALAWK